MQLELFFKVGYVCTLPKGVERNRICTQFAVLIQCHDSTGCDGMGDYFAMSRHNYRHCEGDLNKDCF